MTFFYQSASFGNLSCDSFPRLHLMKNFFLTTDEDIIANGTSQKEVPLI